VSGPPASLTASQASTGVLLKWSQVYAAEGYMIFERDITSNPSAPFTELPLPVPGDQWNLGWGTPGDTYQYEVAAVRGSQVTSPGSPATFTMPNPEPTLSPPTGITVTPAAGSTSITLSWSGVSGATGYNVLWEDANSACQPNVPSSTFTAGTSYTLTGLIPGHEYYLGLETVNGGGAGPITGAPAAIAGDGAPAAPVVSAASGDQLTWAAVPGSTGYWIYQANAGTPPTWTKLALEVPQGWNGTLNPGLYAVTAANGTLESPMSNQVQLLGVQGSARRPLSGGPSAINPGSWIPAWLRAAPNETFVHEFSSRA
jgi:hypothetical protein